MGNYMSEHIVSVRIYLTIFLVLLAGTAMTVIAAFYDFPGPLNAVVALTIASIKATLVVLYFMHVRYSGRLIWLVIVAALLWLGIDPLTKILPVLVLGPRTQTMAHQLIHSLRQSLAAFLHPTLYE